MIYLGILSFLSCVTQLSEMFSVAQVYKLRSPTRKVKSLRTQRK